MIRHLRTVPWLRKSLTLFLSGGMLGMGAIAPAAHAGKEGVFLDSASYFTLDQASLFSSTLQFSLRLHNGGSRTIDFNNYGVRVTDADGRSFTARLNEKKSAAVAAGQEQVFRFTSNVAANDTADRLKVDIFRWDESQADLMSDIGELSVAAAIGEGQTSAPQLILSMYQLDNTLASDASISVRLGRSYRVFHNNEWEIYSDLSVRNLGTSSLKLPSALQYRMKDSSGFSYSSTLVNGTGPSLLPGETAVLTLQTPVPSRLPEGPLTVQFYTTNQGNETVLGSLELNGSLTAASIGAEQPYSVGSRGENLKITAEKATFTRQSDGLHMQTIVTLSNRGDSYAAVPSLSATYQFSENGAAVSSGDNASRAAYLSPKESVSYYFNAVLPSGVDPDTVQLVLWKAASGSGASASASSSGSSASAASSSGGTSSAASTASGTATGSGSTASAGSSANADSTASASSANSGAATSSSSNASNQVPVMAISLKGAAPAANALSQAQAYELGSKLALRDTGLVDKSLDISLVELHLHENEDYGYKTAVAKFKFTNTGTTAVKLPELPNELIDSQGSTYSGTRQSSVVSQIMPGTSYVVSYSYLLPSTENEEKFALNIYDDKSSSSGKVTLGSYQVGIQQEKDDGAISFYPFEVTFLDDNIAWLYNNGSYTYVLDITLDIQHKDQVIVDQNFSKMEFDMVDSLGRVLGTKTMTFTGTDKLISGKQRITFTNLSTDQVDSGMHLRIYETIDTPNGTVKRLVKELK